MQFLGTAVKNHLTCMSKFIDRNPKDIVTPSKQASLFAKTILII